MSQKNSEASFGCTPGTTLDTMKLYSTTDETRESTPENRENAETNTTPQDETEESTIPPAGGTVPPSDAETPEQLLPEVPPTPKHALTLDSMQAEDTRSPPTVLAQIPDSLYTPGTERNHVAKLIIFESINDAEKLATCTDVVPKTVKTVRSAVW